MEQLYNKSHIKTTQQSTNLQRNINAKIFADFAVSIIIIARFAYICILSNFIIFLQIIIHLYLITFSNDMGFELLRDIKIADNTVKEIYKTLVESLKHKSP